MAAADGEVSDGEDTMQLPPHNDLSDRLKMLLFIKPFFPPSCSPLFINLSSQSPLSYISIKLINDRMMTTR